MATVDKDSANWRLFGGGGLLVGGLLWLIGSLVTLAGVASVGSWLGVIGVLLVGVALFFVAFGETGSNGAVGASTWGKIALVGFGLGWLIIGIVSLLAALGVAAPVVLNTVGGILVIVGGLASALAIYQRHVARGAARWVIFAPVLWGIFLVATLLGWIGNPGVWVGIVEGILFAVTGLLYLLNRKDVG